MSNNFFENHAIYEIMWKNVVERGGAHDNMAHAHCVLEPKATNTHSEYIIFIVFHCNNVLRTRLNVTFICTLPALF